MTQPRLARLASKVLAPRDGTTDAPPPPSPEARGAAIDAIQRAIEARARRRQRRYQATVSVAAAAAIVLAVGAWRLLGSSPPAPVASAPAKAAPPVGIVVRPAGEGANVVGGTPSLGGGQALLPGAHVAALPHGTALLSFATGTAVKVEEGGEVTVVEQGPSQVLALGGGALRADVAKLKDGERFIVRTRDAEVEVHGTSFRVATATSDPSCGAGTTTRVNVYEGVVSVRHDGIEDRVPAGASWPSGCLSAPVAPLPTPSARAADAVTATRAGAGRPEPIVPPIAAPPAPGSDLARQNDMFAGAVAAKRRGDGRDAIARFDAFVAAYPASPLVESALAEKMRILRDGDPPRAAEAARGYLARYPQGFARAEAEAIAAGAR